MYMRESKCVIIDVFVCTHVGLTVHMLAGTSMMIAPNVKPFILCCHTIQEANARVMVVKDYLLF